jgi:2-iminobutanoate/2-iminopropanoate deaminase
MKNHHDIGVAQQIGRYSDAVEVPPHARWLMTSGTPGMRPDGTLPEGITAQAELAWTHIVHMLSRANMTVYDIVKVTQYLTHTSDIASDIADYAAVRSRFLADARPASMLMVVAGLPRPDFLVEVEVVCAALTQTTPTPLKKV